MNEFHIAPGAVKVTLPIVLLDAYTGEPKTGVSIADLTYICYGVRTADNQVHTLWAEDISELAQLDTEHTSNCAKEIGHGLYRLDIHDDCVPSGYRYCDIFVWDEVNQSILPCHIKITLASPPATPEEIVTAIKDMTGLTAGGTFTFAKMMKILNAWTAGKWQQKGQTTTSQLLDPDDGVTVIMEITPSKETPYKTVRILL